MKSTVATINAELDVLDLLETQLRTVSIELSPAEEFEKVHRVALRVAGIVRERANKARKRPLPLNVWSAIGKLSKEHQKRVEEMQYFVALRTRALGSESGASLISRADVEKHRALTLEHLALVRSEVTGVGLALAA